MRTALLIALLSVLPAKAVLADSGCKLMQNAEWPVRISDGHLLVPVSINGHAEDAMIQIGSPSSALMRSAASRLNIETSYSSRQQGSGRDRLVDYAVIGELRIAQSSQRNLKVSLVDGKDFGKAALVVGYDFLRGWDVEFDLANHAVRIFTAQDCGSKTLAYWARGGASEVPLYPNDSSPNPAPSVPVEISAQRVSAYLNSGTAGSQITKELAERLHARQAQDLIEFDTFAIGGETVHNPRFKPTDQNGEFAVLSLDFIQAHRVFVAHSQLKMYFTYAGGPIFNPSPRMER